MLWNSFISARYESQFFSPTFLVRAQCVYNVRVQIVHKPPFNNIVSGVEQSKQVASVICWTGSISYRLSVFWFMYPLHCCTVVLIFYQSTSQTSYWLNICSSSNKQKTLIYILLLRSYTVCCCSAIHFTECLTPKCHFALFHYSVWKCCPCCFQWCQNKIHYFNRVNEWLWIPRVSHNVGGGGGGGGGEFVLPDTLIWILCSNKLKDVLIKTNKK